MEMIERAPAGFSSTFFSPGEASLAPLRLWPVVTMLARFEAGG